MIFITCNIGPDKETFWSVKSVADPEVQEVRSNPLHAPRLLISCENEIIWSQ